MKLILTALLVMSSASAFAMSDEVYMACLSPVQTAALAQAKLDFPERAPYMFTYYNSGLNELSENPLRIASAVFSGDIDAPNVIGHYAVTLNYDGRKCTAISAVKLDEKTYHP